MKHAVKCEQHEQDEKRFKAYLKDMGIDLQTLNN